MNTAEMQKLCAHLNEFALPRAVVDFDQQRFVAWNTRFLARTGYSEEEIKTLETGKAILSGDSVLLPPPERNNSPAEFVAIAVRVPTKTAAVPGHLVRSKGNVGYLMLRDIEPTTSTKFEQGRLGLGVAFELVPPSQIGGNNALLEITEALALESPPIPIAAIHRRICQVARGYGRHGSEL